MYGVGWGTRYVGYTVLIFKFMWNQACDIPLFSHCLLFDLLKERRLVILVDHLLEKVLAGYQVLRLQNGRLISFYSL